MYDIHFAAVRSAANDGRAKTVVPFQCSLAEASRTVDRLPWTPQTSSKTSKSAPQEDAETLSLGSFCVFSSTRSNPPALVVVGTKSWSCASMVFAFMKRVLAEMTRDPADIGYWQLRSLAWRAEGVAVGDGSKNRALPPPLLEGHDWNDEESEGWEDEDMWSNLADDLQTEPGPGTEAASAVVAPVAGSSGDETGTSGTLIPLSADTQAGSRAGASEATGATKAKDSGYQGVTAANSKDWKAPFFETNFDDQPSEQGVIFLPLKQAPGSRGAGPESPAVFENRKPPVVPLAAGNLPLASAPAHVAPSVDTPDGHTMATGAVPPAAGAVSSHVLGGSPAADTLAQKGRFFVGDGSPKEGAPIPGDSSAAGLAEGKPDASATRNVAAPPSDSSGVAPAAVSVAVSEDLAYVHRGSVLQSYAVTGSILVAASPGTRARVRVTDKHGHIATATGNAAVVEETATAASTREYLCKPRVAQAPGATSPTFLPTVMYRCSPAVKQLPVRVTCRLRLAGSAVLVWVQVIANPQVPQSLSGVSVLVHMPFVPRQEEGVVKSEPRATWKAESRMLEWVLPAKINRGGKQVVQARLGLEEGGVRVASVPPTTPVMVKCHLLDSMFSSVELQASGVAREGDEVSGKVMKRCRVQCRQQA